MLSDVRDLNEAGGSTENAESSQTKTRSRKRTRDPTNWMRNVRQRLRNSGKEYTSRTGKKMGKKTFQNRDCSCKLQCMEHFSEAERRQSFDSFWEMGHFARQQSFISGLVKKKPVERRRARDSSRAPKECSYVYSLNNGSRSVHVCRRFFTDTFCISDGRLSRLLKAYLATGSPASNPKKGKEPTNKISEAALQTVHDHISGFPAYTSHYSRNKNPNRKYLHPGLNIRKLYHLYRDACKEKNQTPVKESKYRHIFNTEYNLHFKAPHKDTCTRCDTFAAKVKVEEDPEEKKKLECEHEVHLRKAEKARASLKSDTALSGKDGTYVFTFDLEKALAFPRLTTSVAYYKRNMYVYNLGIHAPQSHDGFMFLWDETIASRGAQEVASCIVTHLKTTAPTASHIIAYSDCCSGQNRNIKLATTFLKLVSTPGSSHKKIDHKFLTSGHTFLPNDADFGVIESSAKKIECIYSHEDWYNIIKKAKKKKPFTVRIMETDEFLSTDVLEKAITNRKKDEDGNELNWLQIQWMRFEQSEPYKIQFKYTTEEEVPFRVLNLTKRCRGRPPGIHQFEQRVLYPNGRPVTAKKKADMLALLQYIPPVAHPYYLNLQDEENNEEDDDIVYS